MYDIVVSRRKHGSGTRLLSFETQEAAEEICGVLMANWGDVVDGKGLKPRVRAQGKPVPVKVKPHVVEYTPDTDSEVDNSTVEGGTEGESDAAG
jgi:hypothetical protein